jgi:hypothetical protein
MLKYEYSEKEISMFSMIGVEKAALLLMPPVMAYNTAARIGFIEGKTGQAAESLRRCLVAFDKFYTDNAIRRMTKEWDSMIQLEDDKTQRQEEVLGCLMSAMTAFCDETGADFETEMAKFYAGKPLPESVWHQTEMMIAQWQDHACTCTDETTPDGVCCCGADVDYGLTHLMKDMFK